MDKEIEEILKTESGQIDKLHQIVQSAIDNEKLIIDNLVHPTEEFLTTGQKISDKVAKFGGSWAFIISFFIVLLIWIVFNSVSALGFRFDPYPYILMNLILSCIAALQAPIIMMSQNRQEEKDRKRSENDYLINLKSELEIKALNEKIDLLLEDQIKVLFDSQMRQLELLKSIKEKLDTKD